MLLWSMRRVLEIVGLVVTGLLVFVVMIGASLTSTQLGLPAWVGVPLAVLLSLALGAFGMVAHSWLDWRLFSARMRMDSVADLAARDLLASAAYHARRACQVEESEDEGSHYLLELEDGSVLYVTGQFLYEYEACEDDEEQSQPRRFPCTEFTVHSHRTRGHVVEIECRGNVIEPDPVLGVSAHAG